METEKKPLIILTGPTAVGKTDLSIALAKAVNGAVISADSMQVYRYMDIGSAKISKKEMQGVPHYLVDEFMPDEEFNVVKFQEYAKRYLKEIYEKGQIPILVGGTGFYIQAVLYDIDFTSEREDTAYREQLEQLAKEHGAEYLHQMLEKVDAASAKAIHPNNVKRVIRALEFYEKTGRTISSHNEREREKESPYNAAYFVLNDNRDEIYRRIDLRVDQMMEQDLLNEAKRVWEHRDTYKTAAQAIGYKEFFPYFAGESALAPCVEKLKQASRNYAKRQLTWFRHMEGICWLDASAPDVREQAARLTNEFLAKG